MFCDILTVHLFYPLHKLQPLSQSFTRRSLFHDVIAHHSIFLQKTRLLALQFWYDVQLSLNHACSRYFAVSFVV